MRGFRLTANYAQLFIYTLWDPSRFSHLFHLLYGGKGHFQGGGDPHRGDPGEVLSVLLRDPLRI